MLGDRAIFFRVGGEPVEHRRTGRHRVGGYEAAAAGQRPQREGLVAVQDQAGGRVGDRFHLEGVIGPVGTGGLDAGLGDFQVSVNHLLALGGEIVADDALQVGDVETQQTCGRAEGHRIAHNLSPAPLLRQHGERDRVELDVFPFQVVGQRLRFVIDHRAAFDDLIDVSSDRLLVEGQQ